MEAVDDILAAYRSNTGAIINASEPILMKLLSNVINDPTNEKKRSVRLENPKIAAALAPRGAVDIMRAAGFVESDGVLSLPMTAPIASVQAVLSALQQNKASHASTKQVQHDKAHDIAVREAKKRKSEADKRRAEAKAKIKGQRAEEKTYVASVSQHKGFGAGDKQSATQLGAGGDAKGGG